MTLLLNGFHPTFDALSACADLSDVDAVRTRVGRHAARCAACRATVAEIRALGDAARAVELSGAPSGLWERIERAARSPEQAPPRRETPPSELDVSATELPWRVAPALRPTTHVPSPVRGGLRRGAIAIAAAAVIVTVLLVPMGRGERLQAAAKRDVWRITPSMPRPGEAVTVRFEPGAGGRTDSILILLGGIVRRWNDPDGGMLPLTGLLDSLGTLSRQGDGAYVGRLSLPAGFVAAVLRLTDLQGTQPRRVMSPWGPVARVRDPMTLLVSADSRGRPSLAALTEAASMWTGEEYSNYAPADTLVKYFPQEPIGYAMARHTPRSPRRLIDDLIGWFKSGERQYLRFDSRFTGDSNVSVEHEMAMIAFARRIDEPGEVRKWTMRLVRDHPESPRALQMYNWMLHESLSRPNTLDSVRRGFALADTLWERNGHRGIGDQPLPAVSVGDSATARRWTLRYLMSGVRDLGGMRMGIDPSLLTDPEVRRLSVPLIRDRIANSCALPSGKYPLWSTREFWRARCEILRLNSYATLSEIARMEGRPRQALVLADSAALLMNPGDACWMHIPQRERGAALLDLGDTTNALPMLAAAATGGSWQNVAYRDSLRRVLGRSVNDTTWRRLTTQAEKEQAACLAARPKADRQY